MLLCKALRDRKRVITAYWLNDSLLLRRMFVPSVALHFPYVFGKERPCSSQVVFISCKWFLCTVFHVKEYIHLYSS